MGCDSRWAMTTFGSCIPSRFVEFGWELRKPGLERGRILEEGWQCVRQ